MLNLNDKRVLITGANGFLGRHVTARFQHECGELLTPRRGELDLLDREQVKNYLDDNTPDVIVHLAAKCGGIGINRERPADFLYDNLQMTMNLIDEASYHDPDKFVGIGTVCSYPKFAPIPFKEEDLYNGYPEETNAGYGIAKRLQLEMLRAYEKQHDMKSIFLVPVNMVGEWDNFDDESSHVIPAMMKRFHRAKEQGVDEVVCWGTGRASREFLYAGDCAEAILQATKNYNKLEPVNIGTGSEWTIEELTNLMCDVVGYDGAIAWDHTKPDGQPRRCLDVSKAKQEFGFEAQTTLRTSLERTYEWAKINNVL